ncbi:hypothetical protein GN958_ATG02996 [Phytophthora infestans]|uniref:Uncharacterized protein n=1 Tax=Phytophthora infestans TaxID=4787 RepID=A0A8S9V3R2_PHYIN|nr:hypothetical protein GN958_ATG02996 [Phytophthora infestans]
MEGTRRMNDEAVESRNKEEVPTECTMEVPLSLYLGGDDATTTLGSNITTALEAQLKKARTTPK